MNEQDPFSKAGKWKVPGRNPEPEPEQDITRPMPAAEADDVTRVRPAPPPLDDVTRAAPALPPDVVTRIESENDAPPAELTRVAEPVDLLAAAAPNQPARRLRRPLLASVAALIALALYIFLGR
jgi:hypothetical protein